MANYAVVRTDRMTGTDARPQLVSFKYMGAGSTATAIENGNVVLLNGLMTNEREVFKAVTPAANSAIGGIVLVASPENMYDERKHNLDEFRNEAGDIARGYLIPSGCIFSVTIGALNTSALDEGEAPAVGNIVELMAGTKLKVVESATSGSTVVGKIIEVAAAGRYTYYAIMVN